MRRRELMSLSAGVAMAALAGHGSAVMAEARRNGLMMLADLEPDGMWLLYRRYRLMIVGQRDDETAQAFAGAVADVLARFLPTSRAQLTRAADTRRVGVLIATNQQDVAIMTAAGAEALFLSKPPFKDIRELPLRLIVSFGRHVLVCRPDFRARYAFVVAKTLTEHSDLLPKPAVVPERVVPVHRGALSFFAGEELPSDG